MYFEKCKIYQKQKFIYNKLFHCFSKYSPSWSIHFCICVNQFSKHFANNVSGISETWALKASTASSGVQNRCPRSLFFIYVNKKIVRSQIRTIRRMEHNFYFLDVQKVSCLLWIVWAVIVIVENDAVFWIVFPYFCKDFWQENSCVPRRINRPLKL